VLLPKAVVFAALGGTNSGAASTAASLKVDTGGALPLLPAMLDGMNSGAVTAAASLSALLIPSELPVLPAVPGMKGGALRVAANAGISRALPLGIVATAEVKAAGTNSLAWRAASSLMPASELPPSCPTAVLEADEPAALLAAGGAAWCWLLQGIRRYTRCGRPEDILVVLLHLGQ